MNDPAQDNSKYKKARDDKYRQASQDRLAKIAKKKIQTTMIGALSSIEEHLGPLWKVAEGEEMTAEQQAMFDTYQLIRSEILDKGNTQVRNMDAEIVHYDIKWLKFTLELPVKQRPTAEYKIR
jgi:hypothetical protein